MRARTARFLAGLVLAAVGCAVLPAPALAGDRTFPPFGGVNRDPSRGQGIHRDHSRALTGRHPINETNPVYVPGQSPRLGPPVIIVEPVPVLVWVAGYWAWDGVAWVWVPGHWTHSWAR